jgi:hypothetical protein
MNVGSAVKTRGETEAATCKGITRFEQDDMGLDPGISMPA